MPGLPAVQYYALTAVDIGRLDVINIILGSPDSALQFSKWSDYPVTIPPYNSILQPRRIIACARPAPLSVFKCWGIRNIAVHSLLTLASDSFLCESFARPLYLYMSCYEMISRLSPQYCVPDTLWRGRRRDPVAGTARTVQVGKVVNNSHKSKWRAEILFLTPVYPLMACMPRCTH